MSKECVICGEKAGFFSKKTGEGKICKKCLRYVPRSINLPSAGTDFLKKISSKNIEKSQFFETTASYEGIYIDTIHGMFCYSEKGTRDEPHDFKDIYRIDELTEVGIFCSNAKNVGTTRNIVICDIKFRVKTKDINVEFLISKGKKCSTKVKDGKLEWTEPNELSMFRNMFNQMIDTAAFGMLEKLKAIQEMQKAVTIAEKKTDWAKGILFIGHDEECTSELIKAKRNEMVKIFHPDRNSPFADTEIASQINEAYKILSQ